MILKKDEQKDKFLKNISFEVIMIFQRLKIYDVLQVYLRWLLLESNKSQPKSIETEGENYIFKKSFIYARQVIELCYTTQCLQLTTVYCALKNLLRDYISSQMFSQHTHKIF